MQFLSANRPCVARDASSTAGPWDIGCIGLVVRVTVGQRTKGQSGDARRAKSGDVLIRR